jgi:predicted DNA-binding transcriptional regulator YafY
VRDLDRDVVALIGASLRHLCMRRADRLFEIIQVLRRSSRPLTAAQIAEQIETSKRTVYRDIASLIGQRVPIRGEAGVGFTLDRGFDLPPLMLTPDEIEAVVLGAELVKVHADPSLARAAIDVLTKVAHILPKGLRDIIDEPSVGTPPSRGVKKPESVDVARLRLWSRQGRKLRIQYVDESGATSSRTVWPFMVGYVLTTRVLIAWCELREGFRYFRTDRLAEVMFLEEQYPETRSRLRRRWLEQRGLAT